MGNTTSSPDMPSQQSIQAVFMKAVREKSIQGINICAFLDKGLRPVKRETGQSPTYMFFGLVNDTSVFVKSWFEWDMLTQADLDMYTSQKSSISPETNAVIENALQTLSVFQGLTYEAHVYKKVSRLVATGKCFNFLPVFALARCKLEDVAKSLTPLKFEDNDELHVKNIITSIAQIFPNMNLILLTTLTAQVPRVSEVSEKLMPLYDYLRLPNPESVREIMLQLLYTLYVLEKEGIVHNDLHYMNILVEHLEKPVCMSFKLGDRQFTFKCAYIPKIYDWDRAYCVSLGINPGVSGLGWASVGQRNMFRPNMNLYMLIAGAVFTKEKTSLRMLSAMARVDAMWMSPPVKKPNVFLRGAIDPPTPVNFDGKRLQKFIETRINDTLAYDRYFETFSPGYTFVTENVFTIDRTDLERLVDASVLDEVFNRKKKEFREKYDAIQVAFLSANSTWTKLYCYPGWGNIPLHDYGEPMLSSVASVFAKGKLFKKLTKDIVFCQNASAEFTVGYEDPPILML